MAVVGAGWSGIAAAWYLHQAGHEVTLFDNGVNLGGRSASTSLGQRAITLGGKNIGQRYRLFREFAAAMMVGGFEPFGINSSRIENGQIRTLDSDTKLRSAWGYIRHASPPDLLRFARLVRLVRGAEENRFLRGAGFTALVGRRGDLPLDQLFGEYLRTQLIRMMTVRMNGAEPDEVYIGNFGTNLGMLLDHFDQPVAGFDPMFRAFSGLVTTRLRTQVTGIVTAAGAAVGVTVRSPDGAVHEEAADAVVVAVPSWDAAALVDPLHARLADALREIRYFPVGVAVAEYDGPVFTPQVRALVLPPASPLSNAGAYGVNDLQTVRYTFSGRAARPFLAKTPDATAMAELGEQELTPHIPVSARSRIREVATHWERGLCAYGPEHDARLSRIHTDVSTITNLMLTGDYVRGASIEACFRAARAVTAPLVDISL